MMASAQNELKSSSMHTRPSSSYKECRVLQDSIDTIRLQRVDFCLTLKNLVLTVVFKISGPEMFGPLTEEQPLPRHAKNIAPSGLPTHGGSCTFTDRRNQSKIPRFNIRSSNAVSTRVAELFGSISTFWSPLMKNFLRKIFQWIIKTSLLQKEHVTSLELDQGASSPPCVV